MNRRDFVAVSVLAAGGAWTGRSWGADPVTDLVGSEPARAWFRQWLAAFNAEDPSTYRAFVQAHVPDLAAYVDDDLATREASGGLEVLRASLTAPGELTVWVKDRGWDRFSRVVLTVGPSGQIADINFAGAPVPENFKVARRSEAEAIGALDKKLRAEAKADRFSGAVLVAKGARTPLREAYGLADRAKTLPATPATRFCVGSMGKMFTAVGIVQQIQAGRIRLADPVAAHLPDYPNAALAKRLTIEHLLTHTGGTGDIFGPFYEAHQAELNTLADYVRLYGPREPVFEPGSKFGYSNYGFVLLGAVLERTTGQTYDAYCAEHVFRPAGMTATGPNFEDGRTARPYSGSARTGLKALSPYVGLPAGGGYSTVDDLRAFADALRGHRLLDAEHTTLLTTGRVDAGGTSRWALGFKVQSRNGEPCYGHGGGAPGVNGDLAIYPRSGYVTAVLCNRGHPLAVNAADYVGARLPASSTAP